MNSRLLLNGGDRIAGIAGCRARVTQGHEIIAELVSPHFAAAGKRPR